MVVEHGLFEGMKIQQVCPYWGNLPVQCCNFDTEGPSAFTDGHEIFTWADSTQKMGSTNMSQENRSANIRKKNKPVLDKCNAVPVIVQNGGVMKDGLAQIIERVVEHSDNGTPEGFHHDLHISLTKNDAIN